MIHRTQSCTLGAILFLVAASLPGCGEDNQRSAKIGESVAKDNRTEKDREQLGIGTRSGSPTSRPAGYTKPLK